jgi:hypothetical protein
MIKRRNRMVVIRFATSAFKHMKKPEPDIQLFFKQNVPLEALPSP